MNNSIPRPKLRSWMHERIPVPELTPEEYQARWKRQPVAARAIDAILSRIMVKTGALAPGRRWTTIKAIARFYRWWFRLLNRFRVFGLENVPETGCIFYVNHPGVYDPMILLSALDRSTGAFVSWGNGWFMDMIEQFYGFVSSRNEPRVLKVEKMIRQIIRNPFFAIWPEGHPTNKQRIEDGFSSIIRVYAAINARRDRLPFLPVLLRGSQIYQKDARPRVGPIEIHFLKPLFLPREWLKEPEKGGKTPRELIDFLMHHLAAVQGQRELDENPRLVFHRRWHSERAKREK